MKEHGKQGWTRRETLRTLGAAFAAPAFVPASVLGRGGRMSPSEKIRLGVIGVNDMGRKNLALCAKHSDVVVTAVCDVWKARRDEVLEAHKTTAKGYHDYRELLASDEVDAVIIATPPHWHALMAIHAAEAGKDIYLQKPMTMYPGESRAVRNAVNKHGRICQIGTQRHTYPNYHRVVEWIRSGKLGPVSVARTFYVNNQGAAGIGRSREQDAPEGLDWNFWLGPAPVRPYHPRLAANSFHHCWFWDYSGGWTLGMGPHVLDLSVWALDLGAPLVTSSSGGRFVMQGDGDAPDAQEVVWRYPNMIMTWSMNLCNSFGFNLGSGSPAGRVGVFFQGQRGTLMADYDRHEVVPEGNYLPDRTPPEQTIPESPGHEREWLDSIRSRKPPSCDVNFHYKIDLALTLANLSYKLGRSIRLDPETEQIVGDEEAARKARPVYRDPWKFPEEYL